MSKPDFKEANEPRGDVKELLDRCRGMEKELAEIKERLARIQKAVEEALRKRSGGSSLKGQFAKPPRSRLTWPPEDTRRRPVVQLR